MLGTGDWMRQARHPAPHPCATLKAAGCPPDIRHGKDQTARRTGSLTRPAPNPGGVIQATRHRGHPATPPGTLEPRGPPPGWDGAAWRSHRCWSSGPAPRCKSGVSPGPEGTGQRALPRCKTGPSHRQGDGTEEEPQGQSSWLARGALKRGVVISRQSQGRRGGRGRGRPPALPPFISISDFKQNHVCYGIPSTNPSQSVARRSGSLVGQQGPAAIAEALA